VAALRVSFRDAIPAQPQDSRFKAAESASKGAQSALSMLRGGCPVSDHLKTKFSEPLAGASNIIARCRRNHPSDHPTEETLYLVMQV
jgi:hypothetical protein